MTAVVAALLGLLAGAALCGALVAVAAASRRRPAATPPVVAPEPKQPALRLLELLQVAIVLVGEDDVVQLANDAAVDMGVVAGGVVGVPALAALVRDVRRRQAEDRTELSLDHGDVPRRVMTVQASAVPVDDGEVALVVEDVTEAHRVDSVRRDFVANVGHEIKTPVGALQLLAEAALDAHDDPEAVERFVGRMQLEATRLSRLVQDLLDLSRLQGGEPLPDPRPVSVDAVLDEAVDRARLAAEAKQITIVRGGERGQVVLGDESQLVIAVSNLLVNAVAYSPEATRVVLAAQGRDGVVEITVTDQGIGIAQEDQDRIFERFYRADPARSRATGGTGLGLAIVKHTVGNHGGQISVWSRPGAGSTFTIRLAAASGRSPASARSAPAPADAPREAVKT